ncbi:uncharacterized protein DEA37_0004159 [Paragonimus westermani]|uniref:C2H2-type domain-containing protein n=1 Tax=Paragonimus westermani TaxID=34504 RepID=A0A5J4NCG3_9TREM|nr:uncharacterized protein DEA37_0004159 [Paragonimus westermani]
MERTLTVLRSNSPPSSPNLIKLHSSSPVRVPWISYYFTVTKQDFHSQRIRSELVSTTGLVVCPICAEHYANSKLIQHLLLHLTIDELYLGTLWPFEFCPECIFSPSADESLCAHRQVHNHVRAQDPETLLDGQFVCPICEQSFTAILKFAVHLYERHVFRDAPYVCTICYSFYSSRYFDLVEHLHSSHAFTNHVFCPYCLKYFELPVQYTTSVGQRETNIFTAHRLLDHMRSHWDDLTYRCECCRLDFVHRKDLRIHEYLHHCGHHLNPQCSLNYDLSSVDDFHFDTSRGRSSSQPLSLYYSNQLRTSTPRMSFRCLECGETLRLPISRHFNLTVRCPSCRFSSSCSLAVHRHWCSVHSAPSIPAPTSPIDLCTQLTSWERCISSLVGTLRLDEKVRTPFTARAHDPCGSLVSRMRRCKHKHSPPGLEFRGTLLCPCGFRTIAGNQMARHLATKVCGSTRARLDYDSRLPLFQIVQRSTRALMRVRRRISERLQRSPFLLQSVGLCSV